MHENSIKARCSRITLLCWLCAGTLVGLLFAKQYFLSFSEWWLLLAVPLFILSWRWPRWAILYICMVGLCIGMQRGGQLRADMHRYDPLFGHVVEIVGHVRDDPVYDDMRRLDFRIDKVHIRGTPFPGQIRVRSIGATAAKRGDYVRLQGKLLPGYGNYQASVSFVQLALEEKNTSWLQQLRRRFFAGVYNALPDPQASLGLGFLVGLKAGLPDELEAQLRAVALTHIVVASGYNLTILIRISRRLLARSSHFQAFAGSMGMVGMMLTLTGLSPSMMRAGVVTLLSLATWYYGRKIHPVLIILMSAALTAWLSPLYLWYDLGWWLSFLAFSGVLLVAPLLTRRLFGNKEPPLLGQVAVETIAAQIMVEPLIMLMFGQISVLGLAANILVVPFIPFAMLATFVAGAAGILFPAVAGWFAWPAQFLLSYIIEIVQLLAGQPWSLQTIHITPISMCGIYGGVAILGIIVYRKLNFCYRDQASVVE